MCSEICTAQKQVFTAAERLCRWNPRTLRGRSLWALSAWKCTWGIQQGSRETSHRTSYKGLEDRTSLRVSLFIRSPEVSTWKSPGYNTCQVPLCVWAELFFQTPCYAWVLDVSSSVLQLATFLAPSELGSEKT